MTPLFETIIEHVPPPFAKPNDPFHMLVSNIDWSDYVGRIAVGKILGGVVKVGDPVFVLRHAEGGKKVRAKITKIFEFTGLGQREVAEAHAGNIVGISGFEDVDIGDTLDIRDDAHPLPFTQIDSGLHRKYDGTGLGLPLTKSMVELHGGRMILDSTPGVGTTVTVRFPAERTFAPAAQS